MGQKVTNSTLNRYSILPIFGIILTCMLLPNLLLAQISVSITPTHVKCNGGNNGAATASASGGSGSYSFIWSNGQSGATINNLIAGDYAVTATDNAGGTKTAAITVNQPSQLGTTCFGESQICGIVPDGKATAVPFGGTAPYTYSWSNGGTTAQILHLSEGTYSVTTTDANGCTASSSTQVSYFNEGLWVGATSGNATCFGANNGTAHANAMSGTPPYTYLWSNGSTSQDLTGLAPGTYTVTATDVNGCLHDISTVVTQPSAVTVTTASTPAACGNTGTASLNITGGTAPYTVAWSNGATSNNISNLAPGTYTANVKDANNCSAAPVTVTVSGSNTSLSVSASLGSNATCTTGGTATATVANASGTYSYLWDNGQTSATATNLSVGNHSVTVTSNTTGCTGSASVSVTQSGSPSASATVVSQATCTTGGSATVTASGGTSPYTYRWDNNQSTATATNLSAGNHTVVVTDAGGCSTTSSVNIGQSQGPNASATATSAASCAGGGSASASATGGASPYVYLWDNGQTTAAATNLSVGTHSVIVTDASGCATTATVNITGSTAALTATITASANAKCDQAGSATVSATGGSGTYTYHWDNNESTASAINLTAGQHSVTVTDSNGGCTGTASVNIGTTNNGINIGDYMWYDLNQDGAQGSTETGVANVAVMLIRAGTDGIFGTADDVIVKSTTTNASGKYLFECITPGTYVIMFGAIPTGYVFTNKDNVNNDCYDSDVKTNGKTEPFTITAGQTDNLCFDAGIHVPCDQVSNAGVICCDQTICEGQAPAALYTLVPVFGGTGAIQYQWLEFIQIGPADPTWVLISGATGETFSPGVLTQTSYYMRCARRTGCVPFLESNVVTITVKPLGTPGCGPFLRVFNVNQMNNHTVNIDWTTNPEASQYMYSVQHSSDNVTWVNLADVMGKHDAAQENTYSFVHDQVLSGRNIYRIKRLDSNNFSVISDAVELQMAPIATEESVMITPNPVTDKLSVKNLMSYTNDVSVQIFQANGDVLYTLEIPAGSFKNFDLGTEHLPAGMYFARIKFSKDSVKTIKIAKL